MTDPHRPKDDMLSSIRRLVADDPRGDGIFGSGGSGTGASGTGGKLILTPNLQIVRSVVRPKPAEALQTLHLHPANRLEMTTPDYVASGAQEMGSQIMDGDSEAEALHTQTLARLEKEAAIGQDGQQAPQQADLSEQALRERVRALIREQFQGDLGLRITRSIRKLVKEEIARDLALRGQE